MLNNDMLTPQEREIMKLKIENQRLRDTIQAFKEYDEERKLYYSDLALKVGELESYIAELESYIAELEEGKGIKKLRTKNNAYKEQLKILYAKAYLDKFELDDIKVVETATKMQLQERIKELNSKIARKREVINELLFKMNNGNTGGGE